jgi:hypothetical protein
VRQWYTNCATLTSYEEYRYIHGIELGHRVYTPVNINYELSIGITSPRYRKTTVPDTVRFHDDFGNVHDVRPGTGGSGISFVKDIPSVTITRSEIRDSLIRYDQKSGIPKQNPEKIRLQSDACRILITVLILTTDIVLIQSETY